MPHTEPAQRPTRPQLYAIKLPTGELINAGDTAFGQGRWFMVASIGNHCARFLGKHNEVREAHPAFIWPGATIVPTDLH
jgi:hypothetical protein